MMQYVDSGVFHVLTALTLGSMDPLISTAS